MKRPSDIRFREMLEPFASGEEVIAATCAVVNPAAIPFLPGRKNWALILTPKKLIVVKISLFGPLRLKQTEKTAERTSVTATPIRSASWYDRYMLLIENESFALLSPAQWRPETKKFLEHLAV